MNGFQNANVNEFKFSKIIFVNNATIMKIPMAIR